MNKNMSKNEAENCFKRAKKNYEDALTFMEKSKYAEAIDKFHDSIENLLKSLLNIYDIPYERTHDVTNLLPKIKANMDKDDPKYFIRSELILPPFVAIHKILKSVRNMARYGYNNIQPDKIFNEVLTESIHKMIEGNIHPLKGWILECLNKKVK